MAGHDFVFTSESVTEGHPDKICDQISDAVLDAILRREGELAAEGYVTDKGSKAALDYVRVACESFITTGLVVVGGEIRTHAYVDIPRIVRQTITGIGYNESTPDSFDGTTCGVITAVDEQSSDIAQGVDRSYEAQHGDTDPLDLEGAGDQGMMFGYACNECSAMMPTPIFLAHKLSERLTAVRKDGTLRFLRPDGKTQVSIRYEDDRPVAIDKVLVSSQHTPDVDVENELKPALIEHVITPILDAHGLDWSGAEVYVNPTGRFVIGGPMGDTGLTGRKIIVDTYGGYARHGGGAFSGKDCTKVDRARIGKAVEDVFDLRPGAIIRELDLRRPIYQKTAAYGHFGRDDADFTWERTDKVDDLRRAMGE